MPTTLADTRNELSAMTSALRRLGTRHAAALEKLRYARKLINEIRQPGGYLNAFVKLPMERRARRGNIPAILLDPYSRDSAICHVGKPADASRILSRKAHPVTCATRVHLDLSAWVPPQHGAWVAYCDDEALSVDDAPAVLFSRAGTGVGYVLPGCCLVVGVTADNAFRKVSAAAAEETRVELLKHVRYLTCAEADAAAPARRSSTYFVRRKGHTNIIRMESS